MGNNKRASPVFALVTFCAALATVSNMKTA